MNLVEFVPPTPHPLWELCPQMGITDVIVKVNPDLTGLPDPWRYETLSRIVYRLKDAGLNVVGLEGDPFDMTPIKEFGERGTGNGLPAEASAKAGEREGALKHYRELLESMGRLGIKLLCYNFMVGKGWSRTGVREGRGGAKATYFSLRDSAPLREIILRPLHTPLSGSCRMGHLRGQRHSTPRPSADRLFLKEFHTATDQEDPSSRDLLSL